MYKKIIDSYVRSLLCKFIHCQRAKVRLQVVSQLLDCRFQNLLVVDEYVSLRKLRHQIERKRVRVDQNPTTLTQGFHCIFQEARCSVVVLGVHIWTNHLIHVLIKLKSSINNYIDNQIQYPLIEAETSLVVVEPTQMVMEFAKCRFTRFRFLCDIVCFFRVLVAIPWAFSLVSVPVSQTKPAELISAICTSACHVIAALIPFNGHLQNTKQLIIKLLERSLTLHFGHGLVCAKIK